MAIPSLDGGRIGKTPIILRIVLEYDRLHLYLTRPERIPRGQALDYKHGREKITDIIIGADISKDHIDLYRLPDGKRLRISNDRKSFCALIKWLGKETVSRIVYM